MVMRLTQGLSLIELLATLVILSLLVSLAAPSFSQMLAEQRLRQVGSELRISLAAARSEAVKRNEGVSLIKRGSAWSSGWCVEAGATTACSNQPIQQFNVVADRITVAKNGTTGGDPLQFNAWGRVAGCPEFTLSTTAAGKTCALCLVVTTDGRVQTHSGACPEDCNTAGEETSWSGACS